MTDIGFAHGGDVDIAYRVVGDGPDDLAYVAGAYPHLEVAWELPQYRRRCERLAELTRLVIFDERGMGMTDRVPRTATLEERTNEIRTVKDLVAGSALAFEERGVAELKGVPGEWRRFAVRA